MSDAVGGSRVLLNDDFNTNGRISGQTWKPNVGPGSFINDTTQMRPELPRAQNGNLQLTMDTFNSGQGGPAYGGRPSFFGSEAISQQLFSVGNGIAYEARARLVDLQDGLIGGIFSYGLDERTRQRDELDWELIPKRGADKPQTNIFLNEVPGQGGDWELHAGYPMNEFHTYRIEWLPNQVRWLVDGNVVRTEKGAAPARDMALHLNIWAAGSNWDTGSPNLTPVRSAAQNRTFTMEVDYARVEELATAVGDNGANRLMGSAAADYMLGGGGADIVRGGNGDDTINGGREATPDDALVPHGDGFGTAGAYAERLYGGNGDDVIAGGEGQELLVGGRGEDSLYGGPGDDALIGGYGADRLMGGEGANLYVYQTARDAPVGGAKVESLLDFNPRWGDLIDLSQVDADATRRGDQAFELIGEDAFTGTAGELRYTVEEDGIRVEADVDGDGAADMEIFIARVSSLSPEDLVL